MVKLFEIELSIGAGTGSYVQQRRKIQRLGLDGVYGEIAERINNEYTEFTDNKSETSLSENEIWNMIYKKNDNIFKKIIDDAKQAEKEFHAQRGGCMVFLPLLLISLSSLLVICVLIVINYIISFSY